MRRARAEAIVLPALLGVIVVAVWAAAVRHSGTRVFPGPLKVLFGLHELWHRGVLLPYVRDSLLRIGAGYGAAVVVGIPLGMWLGWSRAAARALNPLLQLLTPISPIAWIPVVIVLFGISNLAPISLVFLGALFPIVLTTQNAVASVPPMYLHAAQNFGLRPAVLLWRVMLPAALPRIIVGLRIALGIGWLVLVAAEMIAVNSGLGYLIVDARNAGQRYDLVVAGMLLIGLVGLVLDLLVRRLETLRALRWGFSTH